MYIISTLTKLLKQCLPIYNIKKNLILFISPSTLYSLQYIFSFLLYFMSGQY